MSRRTTPLRLAPALAALALLAGCFGYPPGAIHQGDTVKVTLTATDGLGAALTKDLNLTLVAGDPDSGLGAAVNDALIGHHANETVALKARLADAIEVPQLFDQRARVQTYNASAFAQAVTAPTVGLNFTAYGYNATVTAVTPALVTFALRGQDGLRQEFPQFGLTMVFSSQGDTLVKTLEPTMPGTVFHVDFTGQIALQALRPDGTKGPLPAGTYRVLPAAGGNLRFDHTAGTDPRLLDQDVDVALAITSVESTAPAPPQVPGGYGARASPQLRGDASRYLTGTLAPVQ